MLKKPLIPNPNGRDNVVYRTYQSKWRNIEWKCLFNASAPIALDIEIKRPFRRAFWRGGYYIAACCAILFTITANLGFSGSFYLAQHLSTWFSLNETLFAAIFSLSTNYISYVNEHHDLWAFERQVIKHPSFQRIFIRIFMQIASATTISLNIFQHIGLWWNASVDLVEQCVTHEGHVTKRINLQQQKLMLKVLSWMLTWFHFKRHKLWSKRTLKRNLHSLAFNTTTDVWPCIIIFDV